MGAGNRQAGTGYGLHIQEELLEYYGMATDWRNQTGISYIPWGN